MRSALEHVFASVRRRNALAGVNVQSFGIVPSIIAAEKVVHVTGNVKQKAISATLWSIARIGFDQFFSFIVFVVIARLLGPVEVGIFALGMIVSELARIFATSGFADAVTKAEAAHEEQVARAAFWGNMALSVVCAIVMMLLAEPIGWMMQTDRLAGVLMALAWTIPLSAGSAIHMARRLRQFGHKTLAIRAFLSGSIGGAIAIAAAYMGYGVWALVIQRFVTETITMVTAWLAYRWWPSFNFSRADMTSILPFSLKMSFSKLFGVIVSRIQDIVIGIFTGPGPVGVYRIGRRTIDMMMTATLTPLSTVAVNFFVAVRDDKLRFQQSFLKLVTVSSCITFPAFFGLAAAADVLVPIVYGHKWDAAIPILQLLTPLCIPLVISLYTLPVLTVFGEAGKAARMTMIQFFLSLALALAAAPFGVEAIVIALLIRTYVMIPYQLRLIEQHTDCSLARVVKRIIRPLAASMIMATSCYVTLLYWPKDILSDFVVLALVVLEGALIYALVLAIIDRQSIRWLLEILTTILRRKSNRNISAASAAE